MAVSEAQAWTEYLAWTRGADPAEYRLTEERAWTRLQCALIPSLVAPSGSDAGSDATGASPTGGETPSRPAGGSEGARE